MEHLLGIKQLEVSDIMSILRRAQEIQGDLAVKKLDTLSGKTVVTLFFENSTRTRMSFELAAKYGGAIVANFDAGLSSITKGETIIDTAKVIDSMCVDCIVIRHSVAGTPELLSKHVECSVINAGDGLNEHPTQSLLDMYTIWRRKGGFNGLKVAIVGDVAHSRVARSNIWALTMLGAEVSVGGPPTMLPPGLERYGVKVFGTTHEAILDSDIVYNLRVQTERLTDCLYPSDKEYAAYFGINENRLKLAKPDCMVMHPMPYNRGVELTSSIIDGDKSVMLEQVNNGIAVRLAVLEKLTTERM